MNTLGLYGTIGGGNSDASISSANIDRLRKLDNQLKGWGLRPVYTSAMGGTHAGGVKGHGGGQKIDWVLPNGQQLTPAQAQWMVQNGYWGGNTGALGWHNAGSGFHYDTYIGDSTNPYNSVIGGAIMENRPAPDLINPTGQIQGLAQGGLLNQEALARQLMKAQADLNVQYDIAAARNEEARRLNELRNQGVKDINTQMYQNRISPQDYQTLTMLNAINNAGAVGNSNRVLNELMTDYQTAPTGEQLRGDFTQGVDEWVTKTQAANPILNSLQSIQNGQLQGYQIDPQKLNQLQALDRSTQNYMASRALMDARVAPERAAIEAQLAQQDPGNAARYAQNAQMLYQMQLANQYGIPYEDLMKAAEMQNKILENATTGVTSGIKETTLQPERTRIAGIENFPKVAASNTENQIKASEYSTGALTDYDKANLEYNKPGAEMQKEVIAKQAEMESKYPELKEKKYETASKPLSQMTEPIIRGNTNIITTTSDNIQKAASDINKGAIAEYEEQGKDIRAQLTFLQEMKKLEEKVNNAKKAGDLGKVVKDLDKYVFDKDGNKYPPEVFNRICYEAGIDYETAEKLKDHYYPELKKDEQTITSEQARNVQSVKESPIERERQTFNPINLDKSLLGRNYVDTQSGSMVVKDYETMKKLLNSGRLTSSQILEMLNNLTPEERAIVLNQPEIKDISGYTIDKNKYYNPNKESLNPQVKPSTQDIYYYNQAFRGM